MTTNHRLLLAARPAGIPGPGNFTADTVPVRTPGPGEALLETLYLSIDPAMRSWMSEGTGISTMSVAPRWTRPWRR